MKVDVDYILNAVEIIHNFNRLSTDEIELFRYGVPAEVDYEKLGEFPFFGLNNVDFVTMNFKKE